MTAGFELTRNSSWRKCRRLIPTVCALIIAGVALVIAPAAALALNLVRVESKTVPPNATNVKVGVFIANEVGIQAIVVPLEIRSETPGAFIIDTSSLVIQENSRMYESPLGFEYPPDCFTIDCEWPDASTNILEYATPSGSCSGPTSRSYTTITSDVDYTSPDAIMFASFSQGTPPQHSIVMAPGADPPGTHNASLVMTFSVTGTVGNFVIDTCCTSPANHILFIDANVNAIVPKFERGVISIDAQTDLAHWPDCGCLDAPSSQVITSPYGARYSQTWLYDYHPGVDIRNAAGNQVHASAAGNVYLIENVVSYGHRLLVESGSRDRDGNYREYMALYHHMRNPEITAGLYEGDEVTLDQVIGHSAAVSEIPNALIDGPHIHFEIWPDRSANKRASPLRFLRWLNLSCPKLVDTVLTSDNVTGRIRSYKSDKLDLGKFVVWMYDPTISVGRNDAVDYENFTQMRNAETQSQTTRGVFNLLSGTYAVKVTLRPLDYPAEGEYQTVNFTVDPTQVQIPNNNWIGLEPYDVPPGEEPAGSFSGQSSPTDDVCPSTFGNVTGSTPSMLFEFFVGRLVPGGVELAWRGSQAVTSGPVYLYRSFDSEPEDQVNAEGLPYLVQARDTVRYLDRCDMNSHLSVRYRLAVGANGSKVFADRVVELNVDPAGGTIPDEFVLHQNFPNPFNSATQIRFDLTASVAGDLRITVVDILGRRIRTVFEAVDLGAGRYACDWDGKNQRGEDVASGVYFYQLQSGRATFAKKMVLMK